MRVIVEPTNRIIPFPKLMWHKATRNVWLIDNRGMGVCFVDGPARTAFRDTYIAPDKFTAEQIETQFLDYHGTLVISNT